MATTNEVCYICDMENMFKANVLQVLPALEQGGVERGTVEMAAYLQQHGWQAHVVSCGGPLVPKLLETGAIHFAMPLKPRTPWHVVANVFRLVAYIKQHRILLVHARSRAPAWSAFIACKITGTPFVATFHGTYSHRNKIKRLYNSVMIYGKYTIAISQFIQQHIKNIYPKNRSIVTVVPRGVLAEEFNPGQVDNTFFPALCAEFGIPQNQPVILLPGRLTRWKGQHILLEALQQIKHMPWVAVLVGGAGKKQHYLAELQQMAFAGGIADRVFFVGNQQKMAELYAAASVVLSTSIEPEAFGRVAIEAQAMGKPVIATAHGGSLETVQDQKTGWLIPPGDAKMLAFALKEALKSPQLLEKMGEAAYIYVSSTYTTNKMCAGELAIYKQILGIS